MFVILGLLLLGIIFFIIAISVSEENGMGLFMLSAFFLIFFLFISVFALSDNLTKEIDIAKYQQEYNSLTYQLENIDTLYGQSYANDRKELYNQIQRWNEKVAMGRVRHNSLWFNWLEPIDFNKFELIEVK